MCIVAGRVQSLAIDYNKPAFLEQVAPGAMKITIAEGERKVQDVKIAGGHQ